MSKKELTETPVEENAKKSKNFKKLKFGSMSVVVIVLVIAIVIVANLMCGLLMKRYPVKLDLTPDNRYELSDKSIEAVKALDKDVEITVMMTKDYFTAMSQQYESMFYQYYGAIVEMPFEIIPEILDKYTVYAEQGEGSISVSYVDMNKDPDVVTRFSNYYNGEITQGSIVLQCGERVKVIDANAVAGMIAPTQDSTMTNINMVFAGESTLTSAIRAVTDTNPVRTAFVTTMNGNAVSDNSHSSISASFKNFLSTNGYDCTEIDVATDSLSPDDYDMLVIACPAVDFSEDIITKISDFLYNGGQYEKDVIYVPNFYATNLPNISAFLADWKIEIQQSAVMDDNMVQASYTSLGGMVDYAPMLQIADSETVGTLPNEALPVIASYAKPINILSKNNDGITKEILKSSASSFLTDLQTGESSDEKASYNVVVQARRETSEQLNIYGSDLLVISSPFMLDSSVLGSTNTYNNASAVLNIVNNISGKEESIIIPEKALQQSSLALTTASARVIQIIVIIVIPLLIAIAGVAVLVWRKNK
ncbi:MAG: GldG family protein [Ruminococcus flavefaciens]|nr:GldG family protein [Ruminococcus flavefaciens]MCM1228944.1 GldG family protein [Ruminococcus flavefaciens]